MCDRARSYKSVTVDRKTDTKTHDASTDSYRDRSMSLSCGGWLAWRIERPWHAQNLDMYTRARCLTIENDRACVRTKEQNALLRQEYPDFYSVIRDLYKYNPKGSKSSKLGYADLSAVRRAASEKLPLWSQAWRKGPLLHPVGCKSSIHGPEPARRQLPLSQKHWAHFCQL